MGRMMLRSSSRRTALVLAVCLSLGLAAGPGGATDHAVAAAPAAMAPTTRTATFVSGARAALTTGGYQTQLRWLMGASAPAADARALPAAAADPVAGLSAAVRATVAAIGSRPAAPDGGAPYASRGVYAADRTSVVQAGGADPADPVVQAAALSLAAALDRYLPGLERAASASPKASPAKRDPIAGCDVVSQMPLLCVGSEADNIYTDNAALLIDMGGNDVYRNSAGGAPFAGPGGANIPVSVNLDMAGNDRYESYESIGDATGTYYMVAQGAAGLDAVGLLVDRGGNDVYDVHVPLQTGGGSGTEFLDGNTRTWVQGASRNGVAGLFDEAGDDRYLVEWESGEGAGGWLEAQAETQAGSSLLADRGQGTDEYSIDGGATSKIGCRYIMGQGTNSAGSAVLFDEGGPGTFDMRAAAEAPVNLGAPETLPAQSVCPSQRFAGAHVRGQGQGGTAGVGALLTGVGDTTYKITMTGQGMPRFAFAWGQGHTAAPTAVAVLDDAGGADAYSMRASLDGERRQQISDACCPALHYRVDALNAWSQAVGQGYAGSLIDHGNDDDSYSLVNAERFRATIDDQRPAGGPSSSLAVAGYGIGDAEGQGQLYGALIDHGGDDAYRLEASTTTDGYGVAPNRKLPLVRSLVRGRPRIAGQGGSSGALLDLGGAQDTFSARAWQEATAPNPANARSEVVGHVVAVHGQGGYLRADAAEVRIESAPADPVCKELSSPGYRGYGTWASSCFGPGFGQVPGATGEPSAMAWQNTSFDATEGVGLPVKVRLVGPDGAPVAGEVVHFLLRREDAPPAEGTESINSAIVIQYDMFEVLARTNADGIAEASLPVDRSMSRIQVPPQAELFVVASFDGLPGQPGLFPSSLKQQLVFQ